MGGAGSLKSTAYDLVRFIQANIGVISSKLFPAMKKMRSVQVRAGSPDTSMGFGWHIHTGSGSKIFYHTGGTGGYSSFMGFDPKLKRGAVIIRNHPFPLQNIGFHIIDSKISLKKIKRIIKLDKNLLKKYVGKYKVSPELVLRIKLRNGMLVCILEPVEYDFEMFAETKFRFTCPMLDSHIEFKLNKDREVTGLIRFIAGYKVPAKKLE